MVEMKPWAEDNFLERLMPQLRQVNRVRLESCPDSELLTAFVEEQVTPFVRGAITAHLATCPECSEVCARLANFARASVPQQDPEWTNVEKRLENAMESFLATKAPKHAAEQDTARARKGFVLGRKNAPRQLFPWRIAFASAGAVAVVIVGGVFAFMHQSKPDNMSARQAPAPQVVVTGAEPTAQNSSQPAAPTPPSPQIAKASDQPPVAVRKIDKPSPAGTAASKPSKPHAEHPNTDQVANKGPAPVVIQPPNDHVEGSRIPMPGGITQATVHIPSPRPGPAAVPQTPAQQAATPQAPTPSSVILGEGERLFIQVSSMSRQGDGTFTFHGTLLQPVNLLVPGTEVFGRGAEIDGKTVVLVSRFVLQGQRYDLVGSGSDLSEVQPGAGKTVQFDNGQVFEVLLSLGSTYQKAR